MILVEDFNDQCDPQFLHDVARPYFKDIFADVAMRSHSPTKQQATYVDNVAFFEFTKLPGIICDRFFSTFERTKEGFILEESFIEGFIRVYLSSLEDKMQLTYDMYDFNQKGNIGKEDVRIVLSYVPFRPDAATGDGSPRSLEGLYDKSDSFKSRSEDQRQISTFIDEIFGPKKFLNF